MHSYHHQNPTNANSITSHFIIIFIFCIVVVPNYEPWYLLYKNWTKTVLAPTSLKSQFIFYKLIFFPLLRISLVLEMEFSFLINVFLWFTNTEDWKNMILQVLIIKKYYFVIHFQKQNVAVNNNIFLFRLNHFHQWH